MNLGLNLQERMVRAGKIRKSFVFSPERYWRYTLILIALLCIAALLFDGFVFWSYVSKLETQIPDAQVQVEGLNRGNFEKIIGIINDKKKNFEEAPQKTPPVNIFAPIPSVSPQNP